MNAFAGIGAELFTPVIVEGGSSFDEPNGADGDPVFLLAGDGVILLYGTKQKESLKKLMDKRWDEEQGWHTGRIASGGKPLLYWREGYAKIKTSCLICFY